MQPRPTFRIDTLGCRVNQYDEELLRRELLRQGFLEANPGAPVELWIVNTCTVTAEADRKARQLIRRALLSSPQTRVIATGCAVSTPGALDSLPPRVLRVPNQGKERLLDVVRGSLPAHHQLAEAPALEPEAATALPPGRRRARALLKVQEGCNRFCSFCIVPFVRGRSRSRPPEVVLAEARALVAEGCDELVVTGVHVGAYGRDLPDATRCTLESLLERLVEEAGAARVRLSSIEPADFPRAVVDRMATRDGICRHLHLAVQHMADPVLTRMRRGHDAAHTERIIEHFLGRHPDGALTGDLLVGFPGESEADFRTLCRFVEATPLAHMHVFPYSTRPGTAAARFADALPAQVIDERRRILSALVEQRAQAFTARFVGQQVEVLMETSSAQLQATGSGRGTTDNYLSVEVAVGAALDSPASALPERGRLARVRCTAQRGTVLTATLEAGSSERTLPPCGEC